ncbi:hypothetical protein SAMD00019534_029490 [Acytostelium subglobosum LB1]|uniref:hypothetical protein n=1 Tax=Acytostelium subglobosum LB1 TaxID=1410327 RepID=UPI000644C734|nr:hypothetical protein SAMD00019534_029490 [Acytostelium subglobosum LB1]GAM19774.1 hypothetical protein SAMD00019534_029490 [Acytostelium subglobosum LB1]|eukprot:XP_012756536.1 hypothetical protein SAMD00019534_029490 [Acytostelium subglobosum LB1]
MFVMEDEGGDDVISLKSSNSSGLTVLSMSVDDMVLIGEAINQHQSQQQWTSHDQSDHPHQHQQQQRFEIIFYFQAHETEVIEILWCKQMCPSLLFVSTSVCSSKLWRFSDKTTGDATGSGYINSPSPLRITSSHNNPFKFTLKKSYEHEEIFNLNSISLNSDGQTFLSSDEFRVYLWDLNIGQQCFNIIDLKPSNIQLLNEIIRVTEFHPLQCNSLIYGTSNGVVKLCDMRTSALCTSFSKAYEAKQSNQSIFSHYLNTILDLKFSSDGRYFVTRNLESLSIWDINVEDKPLATYNLYNQEYLLAKLYDVYESSSFVDRFPCTFINSSEVITGSYDNKCLVWNPFSSDSFSFESTTLPPLLQQQQQQSPMNQFYNHQQQDNIYNFPHISSPPFTSSTMDSALLSSACGQSPRASAPLRSPLDPLQDDYYHQFNWIPVRTWSSAVNSVHNHSFNNSKLFGNNTGDGSGSGSMNDSRKLSIKDNFNSINCVSSRNGTTAISNKHQLFIY